MSKYVVISWGGKQFKVGEGQEIAVDYTGGQKIEPKVLLLVENGNVSVGKPDLPKVAVKLKETVALQKGKKVDVLKYRAKSRYRKRIGFRPKKTRFLVEKIS